VGGRVLRIVTRLNRGGPLRQLAALVPGLAARGWSGPVLFGETEPGEPDGRADLEAGGAELVLVPTLRRGLSAVRDLRAIRDLTALARAAAPDLVHTHLGKAGALGRLVARRLGVPAVHTFHGHHFDLPGARGRWARRAERLLAPLTTRAVCLSERQRRDVVDVHRVLPAQKVAVVPPGLDLDAFRARARRGQAPPSAADGRPFVLWNGRFVRVKDPLLLLDAVERARTYFRAVMLGDGPMLGRTRRAVARRGLLGRVEVVGPVTDPAPFVGAATAVVFTSRSEGTPLAALEAFAVGTPVIAPCVGGLPDLVAHGGNGLWVPPGDAAALAAAIDRLVSDPALARALGRQALADAEDHGAARLADRTAALYADVLAGVASPGREPDGAAPVGSRA
jgi:glycosyltransferase involved in cell wall biosynthesis